MTNQEQIKEIARLAEKDVVQAADALLSFAKEFAIAPRFKHESIILVSEIDEILKQSNNQNLLNNLKSRVLSLTEEIAKDSSSNPDKDIILKRKKEVRDFYINQKPDNDVVFKGKKLCKAYGNNLAHNFQLRDIDITLRIGQITGIVGENGNGKTTLLKIIGGLIPYNYEETSYPFIKKEDLTWINIKQNIGYIPQSLIRWNGSVRENILFTARIKGIPENKVHEEVDYILFRLGLSDYSNLKWNQLSGGYQMRFELARTLIWNPKILILDEPLANLDIKTQSLFLRDLRQLADSINKPMSIIISSQHLYKLESVADNIIFLKEGKAIYNGSIENIGQDRKENCFELACDVSSMQLCAVLKSLGINKISEEGRKNFLLFTKKDITGSIILSKLLESNIRIKYFQDVSHSTRPLFETV